MSVVLVNPPVKEVIEEWDAPEAPHIGLGYLAGYLDQKGLQPLVIDSKLERLDLNMTVERLVKLQPELVGITGFTHEQRQMKELAVIIKKRLPNTLLAVGGVHATALIRETMEACGQYDFLVHGEGEITLFELITEIRGGREFGKVKGIAYREGNEIVVTEKRPWIKDLDTLPFPAWRLFPKAKLYPFISSRGCCFKCTFCMRNMGDTFRNRSPGKVCEEIEQVLDTYQPKRIEAYDEVFGVNSKRVKTLLDMMIERGIGKRVKWYGLGHIDWCNYELFTKMKEAGCDLIGFGVESGDQKVLGVIKKYTTLEKVENTVKVAKSAGLRVVTFFILGHPYETIETIKRTIDFAVKLNPDEIAIGIMTPYPKTEVGELAIKGLGGYRLLSTDWSDFNKTVSSAVELETVSLRTLKFMQLWGYAKVYLWNFRFMEFFNLFLTYRSTALRVVRQLFSMKKKN